MSVASAAGASGAGTAGAGGASARPMPRVVLVTGAAGFIGANAVAWLLREHPQLQVVAYDAMTYAAHPQSLAMAARGAESRFRFVRGDVRDGDVFATVLGGRAQDSQGRAIPAADTVWHLAAESHVDRSILGPSAFVDTNVVGTERVLEALRAAQDAGRRVRLVHVSTDEVFGPIDSPGRARESAPYRPSSPYAASKAAADHFVRSYHRTYGLPVLVVHPSNNFGPFQFPEKLVPLVILNAVEGKPLPIYGDGQQSRDWLFGEDLCRAIGLVLQRGPAGGEFNVASGVERTNELLVRQVCAIVDRMSSNLRHGPSANLITYVGDRPGQVFLDDAGFGQVRLLDAGHFHLGLDVAVAPAEAAIIAGVDAERHLRTQPVQTADIDPHRPGRVVDADDLAVLLLEPRSGDSLFEWGFFLPILQRTEYVESYVMEPMAEAMLAADPKLAEAFAKKLAEDEGFAANPSAPGTASTRAARPNPSTGASVRSMI